MAVSDQILSAAQAAGINPPQLALEVAIQESGLNQNARGAAGEIGIFQLLPSTAAMLGVDPTDPAQNIQGGCRYLAMLLTQFGDPVAAVAAYNAGPGTVQNAIGSYGRDASSGYPAWFHGIPSSTQSYVSSIFNNLNTQYAINFNLGIPEPAASGSAPSTGVTAAGVPTTAPSPWILAIAIGGLALLWLFS